MIDKTTVEDLVSRLVYKPGWTFSVGWSGEATCDVEIEWDVADTSFPPDYEAKLIDTHGYRFDTRVTVHYSNHADVIDVARLILNHAIRLEAEALVHESREFFRVNFLRDEDIDPDDESMVPLAWRYNAIFHPHKVEGVTMWQDTDTGFDFRFQSS